MIFSKFKKTTLAFISVFLLGLLFFTGLSTTIQAQNPDTEPLYKAYEDAFLIGTALNRAQILAGDPVAAHTVERSGARGYFVEKRIITDPKGLAVGLKHFNVITPENVMKWEEIHPEPGVYDFEAADRLVELAQAHGKKVVAHTLVWHAQTPDWVFEDEEGNELSREALLERMRDHIHTIVGRYKGKIFGYDVVNEAFNRDGSFRESKWFNIIGEDFIQKAFEFAHEADPNAQLYYNDYHMEDPEKRQGIHEYLEEMIEAGVPISGVGSQSHFSINNLPPLDQIEKSITEFADLGIDVMITELDLNVLPASVYQYDEDDKERDIYREGLPDSVQQKLTDVYTDLFEIYLKHSDILTRVTLWGVSDDGSWLNYLPFEQTNYPLLFDRNKEPKPALHALIRLADRNSN
ncbi:endo-1,4-beta-xylanase [Gracilimonas mengyeensis]|uniref:Beta-xylanase n=1 Tax=Gracilimonas mengyeensis TaxID=1302730 RepID=A0A521B7D6_9BACT|nr:endo-1,4-beta-xylanase [Gracilimonas mengyeensis]SMO42600.1 endo-1,4-beta-xylanase [Gracilimonas mengyeensis]